MRRTLTAIAATLSLTTAAEAKYPLLCHLQPAGHPEAELRIEQDGEMSLRVFEDANEVICKLPINRASYDDRTPISTLQIDFDVPQCTGSTAYRDLRGSLSWTGWTTWQAGSASAEDYPHFTWMDQELTCDVKLYATSMFPAVLEKDGSPPPCEGWEVAGDTASEGTQLLSKGWPESGVVGVRFAATGETPTEKKFLRVHVLRPGHRVTHTVVWNAGEQHSGAISARNLLVPGVTTRFHVEPQGGRACELSATYPALK